jgi:acyl carrier protein
VSDQPPTNSPVLDRLRESCFHTVLPGIQVPVDDDFFSLGGDSVQLIRLVTLAQHEFDIEIAAAEFFAHPTLGTLADIVERELAACGQPDAESPATALTEPMPYPAGDRG